MDNIKLFKHIELGDNDTAVKQITEGELLKLNKTFNLNLRLRYGVYKHTFTVGDERVTYYALHRYDEYLRYVDDALVIYKDNNDLLLNYELSSIKEFKYDMMVKRLHNTNVMRLLKNTTEVIISGKMVYYK